ncbi:MAG TPA: hypothetical protein VI653_13515, partial [Steroidobacteraceae bacterium]
PTMTLSTPLVLDRVTFVQHNANLGDYTTSAAFTVAGEVHYELTEGVISIPDGCVIWQCAEATSARMTVTGARPRIRFGAASGLCSGGSGNGFINYEDAFAGQVIEGVAALEAVTRGKVRKIASNLL